MREVVPARNLSSADALAVADRLFAAEATWHEGNNLAQTVLTCLYILQPERCVTPNISPVWQLRAFTCELPCLITSAVQQLSSGCLQC